MANSTQSNVLYSNNIFKQYLMQLSTGIVWKDTSRANENETTDLAELYQAELFVVANRGLLNFDVVKSFPRAVLANASVTGANIEIYASDKRKIPEYLRDVILKEYIKVFTTVDPISGRPAYYNSINNRYEIIYDEPNNYYRMLMGLPDRGDTDYVYNTDLRWSTTTPIHEMTRVDRIEMERAGVLDELLKKYPSKGYIAHLGKKYVDPFIARIADRFEILYSEETTSDTLNKDFINSYNSARQMVLSVYYNNSLKKSNAIYDNFLAMCILFIALQVMQHKYLQVDITRDFYDTESLKLVYDSYGVPFFTEIPLDYHQRIVKNINKLISYKGSSKVFFDLFDIFDAGSMDIYSYFLTKTHIVDDRGIPSFIIKTDQDGNPMYNEEGDPILDESNYSIDFSRVKIYDDPALSIADENNHVEYETLTESDPYWIEDAELIAKLSNEDFNYLESKYIGIQTVYDLMKITYENAYIFRMIMDNKELTDTFQFRWTDIGLNVSIFDTFVYLSALYCRFYGYEGLISSKIPAVMDTLGYNFEKSISLLKKISHENSIIQHNSELMSLLTNLNLTNLNSIDTVYNNIEKIREIIIDGYINAKSIEEYEAYRDLYNSLMISKEISATYSNSEGKVYETFTDMLSDNSPSLMQRYLLLEDNEVENEIIMVIDKIEEVILSIRYLVLSSGVVNHNMMEPLFKILNFFKSAKAELVDYNIVYTISMRGVNFFKMMGLVTLIKHDSGTTDEEYFIDIMHIIRNMMDHKYEIIKLREEVSDIYDRNYLKDYIDKLTDEIQYFTSFIESLWSEEIWYIDFIHAMESSTKVFSHLALCDDPDTDLTLLDILEARYKGIFTDNIMTLIDRLYESGKKPPLIYVVESMVLLDKIQDIIIIDLKRNHYDEQSQRDLYTSINEYLVADNSEFMDIFKPKVGMNIDDNFNIFSKLKRTDDIIRNLCLVLINIGKLQQIIIDNLNIHSDIYQNDKVMHYSLISRHFTHESLFREESLRAIRYGKHIDQYTAMDIFSKAISLEETEEFLNITDSLFEVDKFGDMRIVY